MGCRLLLVLWILVNILHMLPIGWAHMWLKLADHANFDLLDLQHR